MSCPACRTFGDAARELHRRVRVRPADDVPDLTNLVLARASDLAPTRLRDAAPSVRRNRHLGWVRVSLACIGLLQLAISVPALFLGADRGAPMHVAHELGCWSAALAVAMVFVALQPKRAAGFLPFAAVVSVGLVITAVVDVVAGHAPSVGELVHLVALAGAVLVWIVARGSGDTGIAPRRTLSAGQRAA